MGVFEIVLFTTTCLSVHVADVKVKSAIELINRFLLLLLSKKFIQENNSLIQPLTISIRNYILSKIYGGLVILLGAEDVDNTFLRKSTIVGGKSLLA